MLRHQWPSHKTPRDATDWLLHLRDMLTDIREIAVTTQQEAKEYSKSHHDIKATETLFENDDKVLVFSPVITGKRSDKLADRWQGPYKVLGKVSPVTYIVDMPERHKRHRTVHVTAMKSWIEPTLSILHIHSVTPTDHDLPDYRCESLVDLNALTQSLSSDKQEALKALLHRFPEVMKPEPGHTHLASHRINTEEALPTALPYYRCPEVWKQPFKEELQYLKENFL